MNWNFLFLFSKPKVKKNGMHVVEACLDICHAKFQVDISIFGMHIAPKLYLLIHLFQTAILNISGYRIEIKMTFLESLDQTGLETQIFYSKVSIRKFNLMWPGVDLTLLCRWLAWNQITKWLLFLNATRRSDHKSCAVCPKKRIFDSGYLSWSDLDPDPCLVWRLCS